jgi:DNA polymerase-3 subunit gamma/tau
VPPATVTPPVTPPPSKSTPRTTVKLTDLLKVEPKKEKTSEAAAVAQEEKNVFTSEQLHLAWQEFAEQRRKFQAEYQLLAQPYDLKDNKVILHLLSPVQETMLNNIRTELTAFLREKLKNSLILVVGELRETEDKKMMYTSRDKFEYLLEKNPALREMKERLGLDPDF